MNIVILSDGAKLLGGAEKVAINSAVELASRGNHVTFFAALGPTDPALLGVENLEVVCLNQPMTTDARNRSEKAQAFRTQLWNRPAADRLREILKGLDPVNSVIHSHCYLAMLSANVIDVALKSGIPFVMTMHDYGVACPLRNFYHAKEQRICHRKPMGLACVTTNCTLGGYGSKLARVANHAVHDVFGRLRSRIPNAIFVSSFSRDILRPFLSSDLQEFVVQNPIDSPELPRAEVESNAEVFTFVGRLLADKDPVTLAIAARVAGVQAHFIGEGPDRKAIMRENPDAEVTGWIEPAEVHRRLRTSRAFVIPSVWYECAPLSTQEAQAHGLPVLTSDVNASKENVTNGRDGFHFRAGDPEALALRIKELQNPEMAKRMSVAAYEKYWASPPTIRRHVDALLETYSMLKPSR